MNATIFMLVSILGQLFLTVSFAREALTTKDGHYCRVKCSMAALLYCFFAMLMTWFLVINPVRL